LAETAALAARVDECLERDAIVVRHYELLFPMSIVATLNR
jgi:hypothetical protein